MEIPEIESVFAAAQIAECPRIPDGGDKEAVDFLQSCIDAGDELYREAAILQMTPLAVEDNIREYAEGLVPIYTGQLWWGWVELGGYRFENGLEMSEIPAYPPSALDVVPQTDFYVWATDIISWRVREMD